MQGNYSLLTKPINWVSTTIDEYPKASLLTALGVIVGVGCVSGVIGSHFFGANGGDFSLTKSDIMVRTALENLIQNLYSSTTKVFCDQIENFINTTDFSTLSVYGHDMVNATLNGACLARNITNMCNYTVAALFNAANTTL